MCIAFIPGMLFIPLYVHVVHINRARAKYSPIGSGANKIKQGQVQIVITIHCLLEIPHNYFEHLSAQPITIASTVYHDFIIMCSTQSHMLTITLYVLVIAQAKCNMSNIVTVSGLRAL